MDRAPSIKLDLVRLLALLAWTVALTWLLAGHQVRALLTGEPPATPPYVNYLQVHLWPILAVGLALCVLFTACLLFRLGQAAHGPQNWITSLAQVALVLVPLVFLGMAPSTGLDSEAFRTRWVDGGSDPRMWRGVRGGGGIAEDGSLSLLDLLMEAEQYAGEEVVVVGRVNSDERWPAGHFMLYRFMVFCCAADARPVGVLVKLPGSAAIEPDAWVRVTGTLRLPESTDLEDAVLEARTVLRTEQPNNPYLMPY